MINDYLINAKTSNLKSNDQWIQKIDESNYYSLKVCIHYEDTLPQPLTHTGHWTWCGGSIIIMII